MHGWIPDIPDARDFPYLEVPETLQESFDIRNVLGSVPIYVQGRIGSCTANALSSLVRFRIRKNGAVMGVLNFHSDFDPSRLFLYYNSRDIQGTSRFDSGASLRASLKALAAKGMCPESAWPYDEARFKLKPSRHVYRIAASRTVSEYKRVPRDLSALRTALCRCDPVVFGMSIYSSFLTDTVSNTGIVPIPAVSERMEGGHAVLCIGYGDGYFLCQNSWGSSWGDSGYFRIPVEYIENPDLSDDFWTVTNICE